MIAITEAEQRVDRRLTAAAGREEDEEGPFRAHIEGLVPLSCAGSEVDGVELAALLKREVSALVGRATVGEPLPALLGGALLQAFWLGFECARAAR